ncbi:hypothetical protein MMC10_007697 [Thelotrema lepadinum]|nr:hypothetical protein [Thelotrema lepadinum]
MELGVDNQSVAALDANGGGTTSGSVTIGAPSHHHNAPISPYQAHLTDTPEAMQAEHHVVDRSHGVQLHLDVPNPPIDVDAVNEATQVQRPGRVVPTEDLATQGPGDD